MRILRTRLYSSSKKKEEDSSDAKERLANSLAYGTALAGIGAAGGAGKLAADELNERLAGKKRILDANEKIAGIFEPTKNKLNREFNDYANSELSRANFKKNGFFKTLKNKVKRVIKDGGFVSVKDAKKALAKKRKDLIKKEGVTRRVTDAILDMVTEKKARNVLKKSNVTKKLGVGAGVGLGAGLLYGAAKSPKSKKED